jgi:hypothetical protein
MQKFWCALSLLVLPLCAIAQEQVPTIRQLYVQDQRERGFPYADNGHDMLPEAEAKKLPVVSGDQMGMHDTARRAQAAKLLQDGKLKTAEDFHQAAYIFQHGNTAEDYLLAHVLAMDAMAKGDVSARWIAAATLDRYLQVAGKKQIFGTQYLTAQYSFILQHPNDKNLDQDLKVIPESNQTLEPYDQTLLPDAVRADFCIPQQKKQTDYIAATNAGKPAETPGVRNCVSY